MNVGDESSQPNIGALDTSDEGSPRIFINYRREDTDGQALALYSHLKEHFGPDNLFLDVRTCGPE